MDSLIPSEDEYTLRNATVPAALLRCVVRQLPCNIRPCVATGSYLMHTVLLCFVVRSPLFENEGHAADTDGLCVVDIAVAKGRLCAVRAAGGPPPVGACVDLRRAMVFPCFVDVHTHIGASPPLVVTRLLALTG